MNRRRIFVFSLPLGDNEQEEEVEEAEEAKYSATHRNKALLPRVKVIVIVGVARELTVGVGIDHAISLLCADNHVI